MSTEDELSKAIEDGDVASVDKMTRPSVIDQMLQRSNRLVEAGDQRPLFLAAELGNEEMCRTLLNNGANIESKSNGSEIMFASPLHAAAINGHEHVCQLLISNGADVNSIGAEYDHVGTAQTVLQSAAQHGQARVCQVLIEGGADIDRCNPYGNTALHIAAEWGQLNAARVLQEHGASIDSRNERGQTPLDLANGEAESYLRSEVVARQLREMPSPVVERPEHKAPMGIHIPSPQAALARLRSTPQPEAPSRARRL